MFVYDRVIRLRGSRLTFDARTRNELVCISHAHADHARTHHLTYATPATAALMHARLGKSAITPVPFGKTMEIEGYRISFHPAGHILGSAQILAEREGERLLYSGDFNTEASAAAERLEIVPASTLIMECTYGHPRYQFPPRAELVARLCDWTAGNLKAGRVPVVIGYPLGKSQEAMKILTDNGFALCVHGTILKLARVYEQFGYRFTRVEPLRRTSDLAGKVLILPRRAELTRLITRIPNKRTLFLSGWAVHESFKYRCGVDEALPLSDHADFKGLLEFVRRVNPAKIFVTHGPADFAVHLRQLGYDARPLRANPQGELF
ncbi:MAG: MBL fold metallo-hydrolase [candidate division KSB1 bacterium]|nr:MBL fold metallo-hydrolase [candidate division KSB1 bacterium]MDZ7274380.1 MBL fold metallo-hydrolase [candidate division KSB1 bacterium]MDZ7284958.1 MBL fold metallo-hydrolase [candidate division KSB1 bacterium]MDZ7297621.1 MBL fold metallo-hydrolase [candidate division KSB1 bacterium]MDZ7306361.1 MBL fold metallo-hydrolase [candidate division KSB1 bacterium]